MLISWTLVLALTANPFPTIALLKEYRTRDDCERAAKTIEVDDEIRPYLACVAFAHEAI